MIQDRPFHSLTLLVATILILSAIRSSEQENLNTKINAQIAEIKRAGYPTTLDELDRWYPPVPAAENSATVLSDGFARLRLSDLAGGRLPFIGKGSLPARGEALPADSAKEVAGLLAQNQEALEPIRKGTTVAKCRYPPHPKKGLTAEFPHLPKICEHER